LHQPLALFQKEDQTMCVTITRLATIVLAVPLLIPVAPGQPPAKAKLLIAFASYKGPGLAPRVFFYEHDGIGNGRIVGSIDDATLKRHWRPSVSADGNMCAFVGARPNEDGRVFLWDRAAKRLVEPPGVADRPNAFPFGPINSTISADGKWLAFSARNRPVTSNRCQVFRYDIARKRLADTAGPRDLAIDAEAPGLSGDGRLIAFVTDRAGGAGMSDIALYDSVDNADVTPPNLNSAHKEATPTLSADGRLLAFVSDRPGGAGKQDIYLYDRTAKSLVSLPGLNEPGDESSAALSTGGRFLAFVSDRSNGEGAGDILLYDRTLGRLLLTPGLNSRAYDFDPCVVELP
jgi:Tol biopolymer transport system component